MSFCLEQAPAAKKGRGDVFDGTALNIVKLAGTGIQYIYFHLSNLQALNLLISMNHISK